MAGADDLADGGWEIEEFAGQTDDDAFAGGAIAAGGGHEAFGEGLQLGCGGEGAAREDGDGGEAEGGGGVLDGVPGGPGGGGVVAEGEEEEVGGEGLVTDSVDGVAIFAEEGEAGRDAAAEAAVEGFGVVEAGV